MSCIVRVYNREHVLHRPDTCVGSVDMTEEPMWLLSEGDDVDEDAGEADGVDVDDSEEGSEEKKVKRLKRFARMERATIGYSPAFMKIFDEALTNASDHHQRHPTKCDTIKVSVDAKSGVITIWNNGPGLDVHLHDKTKRLTCSMNFGEFRTGTNFDDEEERTWGGRNGLGIKLTNAFAKRFTAETASAADKKHYAQTWKENGSIVGDATLSEFKGKEYTQVSYLPDYKRFHMKQLDNDTFRLLYKRACDTAGVLPRLNVFWNDQKINIGSFFEYCTMYLSDEDAMGRFEFTDKKVGATWQVVLAFNSSEQFEQISFVNGLNTKDGGSHVEHVLDVILPHLSDAVSGLTKEKAMKNLKQLIKSCLTVFVAALIPNPKFDSQTKTRLTSDKSAFATPFALTDAAVKKLKHKTAGSLVARIAEVVEMRDGSRLGKTDKSMTSKTIIPKLEEASQAGRKEAEECMMFFTEGDSAKTLVMSGLSVIGKKYYGVFPLRGKVINVRDASLKALEKNKEFTFIKQILGLRNKKDVESKLRYGSICIATDADPDGHHIAGLLANCIHRFWPEKLRKEGFIRIFRTPLVKAWPKGKANIKKNSKWFYSNQEYEAWRKTQTPEESKKWVR